MHFLQLSAQLISFYRRITGSKSRKSWVQWRELTEDIYRFDIDPNQIDLFINLGKNENKKISSPKDALSLLIPLTEDDLLNTLSLVKLYFKLEEKNNENININEQTFNWNIITEQLPL